MGDRNGPEHASQLLVEHFVSVAAKIGWNEQWPTLIDDSLFASRRSSRRSTGTVSTY